MRSCFDWVGNLPLSCLLSSARVVINQLVSCAFTHINLIARSRFLPPRQSLLLTGSQVRLDGTCTSPAWCYLQAMALLHMVQLPCLKCSFMEGRQVVRLPLAMARVLPLVKGVMVSRQLGSLLGQAMNSSSSRSASAASRSVKRARPHLSRYRSCSAVVWEWQKAVQCQSQCKLPGSVPPA